MVKPIRKIKLKEIVIVLIVLILFINLVKSWVKLTERLRFIKETKIKLVEKKTRQDNLKREFARTQTGEFIEKQAREKLNMGKEGELIILLPTPVLPVSPTPIPVDTAANWQKWVRLFL